MRYGAAAHGSHVAPKFQITKLTAKKTNPRPPIDWEAIEREYRAGQLSVVEIARQNKISHTAIQKRAAKGHWQRDLTDKVRREARARLAAEVAEVAPEVANQVAENNARKAVDDAAARTVAIVREHRQDIARLRRIAAELARRLEDRLTNGPGALECVGDKESLSDVLEKLSRAGTRLIQLERQAFNLDAETPLARYTISDRPLTNDEWASQHATQD